MGFSQPQYQQQTQNNLSPAQQNYQTQSANFLAGQTGQNAPAYPGQLTAPLSDQQATSIGQLGALGQNATGTTQQGLNTLGSYASGQHVFDPFAAGLLGSTAAYAENQFNQGIPYMTGPFQMAGQTGASSPMAQYLQQQNANFQLGLQNQLAQQGEGIYQQGQQNQLQAAGAAVPLGQSVSQTGLQAMTMPQQTQQAALTNNYQEYLRQVGNPWQAAGAMPSLTGMPQGQTMPPLYGQSPFSQLFGGISSLAGPFAMLKFAGLL